MRLGGSVAFPESAILSVAKAASKALLPKVISGLIGPAEERRLNAICQKTLRDIIDAYVNLGVESDDLGQVLEVLELTLQTRELDGRYLLITSSDGGAGTSWRAAAAAAGYEPDQLALPLDEVMRRFAEELPSRLRQEAASPDSPLFRLVVLMLLDELAGRCPMVTNDWAVHHSSRNGPNSATDAAHAMCRAADQPFRMPHMLLALLQDEWCYRQVELVRPSWHRH